MNKLNAVIFDLDGVICFTDKYHFQAWKKLADEEGIYFDEEIKLSLFSHHLFSILYRLGVTPYLFLNCLKK